MKVLGTVPQERELPRQTPTRIMMFAAMHQMGVHWNEIVRALGMDKDMQTTLKELDRYVNVHRMFTEGLPNDMFVDLPRQIRCPRCGKQITKVPCYSCKLHGAWPSRMTDTLADLGDF